MSISHGKLTMFIALKTVYFAVIMRLFHHHCLTYEMIAISVPLKRLPFH